MQAKISELQNEIKTNMEKISALEITKAQLQIIEGQYNNL